LICTFFLNLIVDDYLIGSIGNLSKWFTFSVKLSACLSIVVVSSARLACKGLQLKDLAISLLAGREALNCLPPLPIAIGII